MMDGESTLVVFETIHKSSVLHLQNKVCHASVGCILRYNEMASTYFEVGGPQASIIKPLKAVF